VDLTSEWLELDVIELENDVLWQYDPLFVRHAFVLVLLGGAVAAEELLKGGALASSSEELLAFLDGQFFFAACHGFVADLGCAEILEVVDE